MIMTTLASLSAAQQAGKAGTDALAGHVGCSCHHGRIRSCPRNAAHDESRRRRRLGSVRFNINVLTSIASLSLSLAVISHPDKTPTI